MLARNEYLDLAHNFRLDKGRAVREFREALDSGQLRGEEVSIRALAEYVVPDGREWVGSMDPRFGDGTFLEAAGSVSVSDFSNIFGQIIYNRMLMAYANEQFVFSGLVETIPTNLSGERIAGIGAMGDNAEIVEDNKPYPLVGVSEDYIDTPPTQNRGLICPVNKATIFFDRTNLVLTRAAEVGEFLGLRKEKRILDCIVDENSTVARYIWKGTTYATYASSGGHGVVNLKASNGLVDWTNIDAALLVASQIVDPTTGEPVVNMGSDLIVCPQLVATADHIVNATSNQRATPGYATSANPNVATLNRVPSLGIPGYSPPMYNIRTSRLLATRMATKTSWFIGDIRKSFAYMENWPITTSQAPPNSEAEFTQDIVARFKASERGTPATMDVRYMVKNTVA